MEGTEVPQIISISSCLSLAVLYVSSLYIWGSEHNRDHPSTVKKRFFSVFCVMMISPIFVYTFSSKQILEKFSLIEMLGFKKAGIEIAILMPIFLTALLFLGPLSVKAATKSYGDCFDLKYWKNSVTNILWIRNHIVAPLTEEFTFRACMMPLLMQSFTPLTSVFITPLFFGVAHFHHITERLRMGMELKTILIISCFQFSYTTIFGIYSAYLFARTGHFITPFLAHAFCNHMGFPDIPELLQQTGIKKFILIFLYVVGFVGWIYLMPTVSNPSWYDNKLVIWNR